jgi:hypothetical protein
MVAGSQEGKCELKYMNFRESGVDLGIMDKEKAG